MYLRKSLGTKTDQTDGERQRLIRLHMRCGIEKVEWSGDVDRQVDNRYCHSGRRRSVKVAPYQNLSKLYASNNLCSLFVPWERQWFVWLWDAHAFDARLRIQDKQCRLIAYRRRRLLQLYRVWETGQIPVASGNQSTCGRCRREKHKCRPFSQCHT